MATALAMAVVHPQAGNLGGGGFAVVRFGDRLATLDFRETAPAAAHRAMYLDGSGRKIPEASLIGPLAAGVPGSPAGLRELHRRFGRLDWKRVVEPARRLAADGFRVSRRLHLDLVGKLDLLRRFPDTAAVLLEEGGAPAVGTSLRMPELAATLAAYAERGPEAITTGPLAAAIERSARQQGGVLTAADLAAYRPLWREPVRFRAFGWSFASVDLPSSGGILLGETLTMLEALDWSELPRFGAERLHLLAEVWRRAFADRVLLGDPTSTHADTAALLDPARMRRQGEGIDRSRATRSESVLPAPGPPAESPETAHLSVIDGEGNAVALTTTLNGTFGCGLLVREAGFLLNNEMDDFTTAPGQPNDYGLIQGEANAVAPGRRMLSSMSPVLAWRGEELVAAGGRGGSLIPTATAQVLLHLVVDGDPLQTAVDRPRIHHQWLPDQIWIEDDALAPETRLNLEARGHAISVAAWRAKVNAARRLPDGVLEAAGDPRGPAAGGVVEEE